ncbi:MAG TPA: tetratricopeptide repeat protein [Candidatus Acidoferrum sp.]|nr:tetratricopeptide repeat protein [Candidatus Acidoferrum sp.]
MLLRLPNPASRAAVLFAAFVLALALAFFSVRNALAHHASQLGTQAGYERAVRLEPSNALNWYLLGRYWQYSMDQTDPQQAIRDYRISLSLDPLSADTWLDLATAYDGEEDTAHAREAFLAAKRVYPSSAEVSWRYGNFLLREGELDSAYSEIHQAVELDPKRGTEAFSRCWRASPDLNAILDKVLPPSKDIYLGAIRELVVEGQLDPALQVWSRLVALHPAMSPKEIAPLANALLQRGRAEDVELLWQQAVSLMDNPPSDPSGSVIWDGSFESGITGDGLAWQISPARNGVLATLDTAQAHSGKQSLRLMFTGDDNIEYTGPCHFAVVTPGSAYLFSAWIRTEALTTNEGVRFRILSFTPSGNQTAETPDVHGSEPWTDITLPWAAPQGASIVQVCIVRKISGSPDGDIQGTAWVDDVSLVPLSSQGGKP